MQHVDKTITSLPSRQKLEHIPTPNLTLETKPIEEQCCVAATSSCSDQFGRMMGSFGAMILEASVLDHLVRLILELW